MIQANELRIGNWIMDVIGAYKKVNANHILHASNNPDNSYAPIPIEPSILEKAGFEKSGDNEHYFIGHFGFCLVHDGSDWCMKPRINDSLVVAYCKYAHQLQNLYFALTGSELPLNL